MKRLYLQAGFLLLVMALVASCSSYNQRKEAQSFLDQHTAGAVSAETKLMDEMVQDSTELPARFQKPTFLLSESGSFADQEEFSVPVGADISSNRGPVTLRDILKRLAVLKRMNVSWAEDVDQMALVDVDIRAEDDFYVAIDNILRQLDYFYEVKGNSIIVKYRDSKTFHIAMPFLNPHYNIAVGGDVLGSQDVKHKMKGRIELENEAAGEDSFDVWGNIENNLNEILKVYSETEVVDTVDTTATNENTVEGEMEGETTSATVEKTRTRNTGALGYYMIDKPVGLITVTAPRSLLGRIESYFDNLKKVLYRQVSIEAKIVEVTLTGDTRTGIDWSNLLGGSIEASLTAAVDFQQLNPFYQNPFVNPTDHTLQSYPFTINTKSFALILDLMEEQGHVEVLANPRISVMNGQPALISVGQDIRYIESIESSVDDGVITLSATTSSVVSGLGMAVVATVLNDNEVILNLTPVTSELLEEIQFEEVGNIGGKVGLPKVAIREMTSTVRVKSGEMLVVGGLIDSDNEFSESKVKGLGDIPVISKLFNRSGNQLDKKEMVILLRPVILN
ncbi:MAG: type II and III secretion system protein [Thermodesulfobacteriota bacterium]